MNIRVNFNGEIYTGTKDKVLSIMEAKGYSALRENTNPHVFWQVAEAIKAGAYDKHR